MIQGKLPGLLLLLILTTAFAQSVPDTTETKGNRITEALKRRFDIYEPHYVVWENPITEKDNPSHLRFHLSTRYYFLQEFPRLQERFEAKRESRNAIINRMNDSLSTNARSGATTKAPFLYPAYNESHINFGFTYTGTYDFYVTKSELSYPVISRRQNPGIFFALRFPPRTPTYSFREANIFFQHESNGQPDTLPSHRGIDSLAYVSRSWNFLGLELKNRFHFTRSKERTQNIDLNASGQVYLWKRHIEDQTPWDLNDNSRVYEYRGLKALVKYTYIGRNIDKTRLRLASSVQYETGIRKPGANNSFTFEVNIVPPVVTIPLYFRAYVGYGDKLCSYHLKNNSIAVGFMWK